MLKPKLSIPQQISDIKDAGITFEYTSEKDAKIFLENNTYYFKIKAYAKNFDKYDNGTKEGKYINLDFAYLVDLSIIDAHLRKIILKMAIDLEHFLKVKMLNDFTKVDEDGYEIIDAYFSCRQNLKYEIDERMSTSSCGALIQKYKDCWAIWNIVEVLSFGNFVELYQLFYYRNKFEDSFCNMLLPIKAIRNAAAHNNCLINHLRPPLYKEIRSCYEIAQIVSRIPGIPAKSVSKKLSHPTIHDFATLLYTYDCVVPGKTKEKTYEELHELFKNRMIRNKEYYQKNEALKSNYEFALKIVEYFC